MKIGIDISQLTYQNTGVANYLGSLLEELLRIDNENEYILFASSMRRNFKSQIANLKSINKTVKFKIYKLPPSILDILWNRLHILSIETLIGDVDVFISSDWTQPPTKKAKMITILYDLVVLKFPNETASSIVSVHKRRLHWVKKECDKIICISESTRNDAQELLHISEEKLSVVYPGVTL